ncbi:hypothetical protein Ddc_01567 [Ditylenchus destructor]|nr:hypothetical protein Ddc_01567 [Ditylenchus destructor]
MDRIKEIFGEGNVSQSLAETFAAYCDSTQFENDHSNLDFVRNVIEPISQSITDIVNCMKNGLSIGNDLTSLDKYEAEDESCLEEMKNASTTTIKELQNLKCQTMNAEPNKVNYREIMGNIDNESKGHADRIAAVRKLIERMEEDLENKSRDTLLTEDECERFDSFISSLQTDTEKNETDYESLVTELENGKELEKELLKQLDHEKERFKAEEKRVEEERRKAKEKRREMEENRKAEERRRMEEEKRRIEEENRQMEEKRRETEEKRRMEEENRKAEERLRMEEEKRRMEEENRQMEEKPEENRLKEERRMMEEKLIEMERREAEKKSLEEKHRKVKKNKVEEERRKLSENNKSSQSHRVSSQPRTLSPLPNIPAKRPRNATPLSNSASLSSSTTKRPRDIMMTTPLKAPEKQNFNAKSSCSTSKNVANREKSRHQFEITPPISTSSPITKSTAKLQRSILMTTPRKSVEPSNTAERYSSQSVIKKVTYQEPSQKKPTRAFPMTPQNNVPSLPNHNSKLMNNETTMMDETLEGSDEDSFFND